MKPSGIFLFCVLLLVMKAFHSFAQLQQKKSIYFHISHHQEAVGHPSKGFPDYQKFKQDLKNELELLDKYGAVSDQCFSDFIVSVILFMKNTGRDPEAEDIFRWFNESKQNLGYHFHPSTWDIMIRQDKIKDMDIEQAITAYEKWEKAYYDWTGCTGTGIGGTFCGSLDTTRIGGVTLMQQYFKKPVVNEVLTILNPAVGQVFSEKYGQIIPVVGQAGNVHSYYSQSSSQNLWLSDWIFSPEPEIYVYKLMGQYFIQTKSEAWTEGSGSLTIMKQALNNLPLGIPHIFGIHCTNPPEGTNPLADQLKFITEEFFPANPESRFISTADIPKLVIQNPHELTINDLDECCRYVLFNWHGRPPSFAKFSAKFCSLATLFKGLQAALQACFSNPSGKALWPQNLKVPDFIWPPFCRESDLPNDKRIMEDFPVEAFKSAILSLPHENKIPCSVTIPYPISAGTGPLKANAAEMLKGMCTLFLSFRQGIFPEKMNILSSYIVPISALQRESSRLYDKVNKTNMDWLGDIQYWTLEPLNLKEEYPVKAELSDESNTTDFELQQNYPNPFSKTTSIRFRIAEKTKVSITIYDVLGRKVKVLADTEFDSGWHTLTWNGSDDSGKILPGNIYFYKMVTNGYIQTKKSMYYNLNPE